MKYISSNPEAGKFLHNVGKHIKSKEARLAVTAELESHIAELADELVEEGVEEQEAVRQAVRRMGEPSGIGKEMQKIYRPVMDWGLFTILFILLGIGLFAMYVIGTVLSEQMQTNMGLFNKQLFFATSGCLAAAVLWRLDYRKLKRFSSLLFGAGIGLMLFTHIFGLQINGSKQYLALGGFAINGMIVAMFMLLIGTAGMKPLKEWGLTEGVKRYALQFCLPMFLFLWAHAYVTSFYFVLGFFTLLWLGSSSLKQFAAIVSTTSVSAVVLLYFMLGTSANLSYVFHRATIFLRFYDDPAGTGYATYNALEAIRTAGWWGHGSAASTDRLPFAYNDSLFAYMISSYGWSMGILIASASLAFLGIIGFIASNVRDEYGKRIVSVLLVVLGIQFVWAIFMCLGWAPFVGVSIPFISYGNTMLFIHLAVFGLIISVSRRRRLPHRKTIPTG